MNRKQIKSFIKIIDPKNFSPSLKYLHYIKDKNVFVLTNAYILLEIKNPFQQFDSDFQIYFDDLKKIKKDIIGMVKEWNVLRILNKNEEIKLLLDLEFVFPDYEYMFEKAKASYEIIKSSNHYSKFFDICYELWLENIEIKERVFFAKDYETRILWRIQQDF